MKKTIKLDMADYIPPRRIKYTQQEKEARIYAMAKKLNVKIEKNDIITRTNVERGKSDVCSTS